MTRTASVRFAITAVVAAAAAWGGAGGSVASYASPAAEPLTLVSPPTVDVLPMVGEQLSLKSIGTWTPAVDENEVLKVEWLRAGRVTKTDDTIFGGVQLKPGDTGQAFSVRVTVQDADQLFAATAGESKPLTVFPRPAITGTPKVGQPLKVAGWPADVSARVAWTRSGVPLKGATSTTYRPVAADRGKQIAASVTLSAPGYQRVTALTLPRIVR